MTVILIFGTSTTYGAWDLEGGWVQRLRKYLDEKQFKNSELYYIVYNLGISGDTSKDILERLDFETKQRLKLLDEGEDVIIMISVGVNDSIINNKSKEFHVPLNNFTSNISEIINLAKKYSNKIVFVGNKPVDDKRVDPIPWLKECSYKSSLVEEYEAKIKDICKKKNIIFIDVYSKFKKTSNYQNLLSDGVHPTTEGHKLIFEIVKDSLIKEEII